MRCRAVSIVAALLVLSGLPARAGADVPTVPDRGALRSVFERAAAEFGCPPEVLWAIAVVRSGGEHRPAPARDGAVGILGLKAAGSPSLLAGALLAGVAPSRAAADLEANVRAGAALLAAGLGRGVDGTPAAWMRAAAALSDGGGPEAEALFLEAVIAAAQRGGTFSAAVPEPAMFAPYAVPVADLVDPWHLLSSRTADYGPALWVAANSGNYTAGRGKAVGLVVVHVMQGSYSGSISWFQNASAGASAHYMIRSSDGQITQMVAEGDTAWHAGNWDYNQRSIGIEHEGYIDNPAKWFTDAMYQESAKLTAAICDKYGIPKDRAHIIGHDEVPNPGGASCTSCSFGGCGCHTDPGDSWDWARYMELVTGGAPPVQTVKLVGYVRLHDIYDATAGIADATVSLSNGSTTTTTASGLYTFLDVPVSLGTVTVTASKTGYTTVQKSKTLAAGVDNWASIALELAGCTPACGGHDCGDDGCGGSCGSCTGGQVCQSGTCTCTPQDHRVCCGDAVCWADSCDATGAQIEACPHGCSAGACNGCVPACGASVCGDDGCGGSCGECPSGATCEAGQCACADEDFKDCCGSDVCWYDSCGNPGAVAESCPYGCSFGSCDPCVPSCDGRECGDDGCGGSCGSCKADRTCVDGECLCRSHDHKACCLDAICWFDSCGLKEEQVVACPNGCFNGTCQDCFANCGNHHCGDDGCGGSCGECTSGMVCGSDFQCGCKPSDHKGCCGKAVCWFDSCGAQGTKVTDCPYGCSGGVCAGCKPACDGRQCGEDGCGGTCGTCSGGAACKAGQCECTANDHKACCGDALCWVDSCGQTGAKVQDCKDGCEAGACRTCKPACEGRTCGTDGCGGTCGTCPTGETCDQGTCRASGADAVVTDAGSDPGARDIKAAEVSHDAGSTSTGSGGGCAGGRAAGAASPFLLLAVLAGLALASRRRRA